MDTGCWSAPSGQRSVTPQCEVETQTAKDPHDLGVHQHEPEGMMQQQTPTEVEEIEGLEEVAVRVDHVIMIRAGLAAADRRDTLCRMLAGETVIHDSAPEPTMEGPAPRWRGALAKVAVVVGALGIMSVASLALIPTGPATAEPFDDTWRAFNDAMGIECEVGPEKDNQACWRKHPETGHILSWVSHVTMSSEGTAMYTTPLAHSPMTMIAFPDNGARNAWLASMPDVTAVTGKKFVIYGGPLEYLADIAKETGAAWINPPEPGAS